MKTLTKITLASLIGLSGCQIGHAEKYNLTKNNDKCPLTYPVEVSQGGMSSIPLVNVRPISQTHKMCDYGGYPKSHSSEELERIEAEWGETR